MKRSFAALFLLILLPVSAHADWKTNFIAQLKNGGAIVTNSSGKIVLSHRADELFIPASTIKVATAAAALHVLGNGFRFSTDFFLSPEGILYIKGYGDPLLTSEEMSFIAQRLKGSLPRVLTGIILDTSYFDSNIAIDGTSRSSNPYDALNSALLVNFNTVTIRKLKNGKIESGEAQTPLTPTALKMGAKLKAGTHRVSLPNSRELAARYVAELLTAFLNKDQIQVRGDIRLGLTPDSARLVYHHESRQSLSEVISGLLEFSTNLTSNQLFLTMGAKVYGAPATVEKGVRVMRDFLTQQVGWKNFSMAEGSGLSRQTKVTPREMIKLLDYFEGNEELLPLKDHLFRAKTGTLNGVNTYMGYFRSNGSRYKFVILVNDQVPFGHKFQLAKSLHKNLGGN